MPANNKREARVQSRSAINKWALGFAAIGWIPGSHYIMTGGDVVMIRQVGSIYAVDLKKSEAAEVFGVIAAPLIGKKLAHTALDFIPGVGWVANSVVGATVTKVVGEALIEYFHDCSPLPP
jgi:uncharacterized protein (DUF697 family)